MACRKCEDAQEGKGKFDNSIVRLRATGEAYYRFKNANIQMNGCDEHLREIFKILNERITDSEI